VLGEYFKNHFKGYAVTEKAERHRIRAKVLPSNGYENIPYATHAVVIT
jgi:hypothetical protein